MGGLDVRGVFGGDSLSSAIDNAPNFSRNPAPYPYLGTAMHIRPSPFSSPNHSLPTAVRVILEEWRKTSQHFRESVTFYPASDAPRWSEPKGSDVFLCLEISKANRLLENGPRTYSHVCSVADKLAFAIVGKSYGIETTARALRASESFVKAEAASPQRPVSLVPRVTGVDLAASAYVAAAFDVSDAATSASASA